jgi:hypothetical protein
MTDTREDIMARLLVLAAGVEGVVTVDRNRIEPSGTNLPAIIVLEGDEEANENDDPSRPRAARRRVTMTPHLVVVQGTTVEDIGPDLNTLTRRLKKAIFDDVTLAALTIDSRGIRYIGMQSDLAFGRKMEGQMAVLFGFTYWLVPGAL